MSLYPDQPVLKMLQDALRPLYVLEGREVVNADPHEWASWMAGNDRTVKEKDFETFKIVTVFLGYALGSNAEGLPLTFVTSVERPGRDNLPLCLHSTWDEAESRHQDIVNQVSDQLHGSG